MALEALKRLQYGCASHLGDPKNGEYRNTEESLLLLRANLLKKTEFNRDLPQAIECSKIEHFGYYGYWYLLHYEMQ